MPSELEKVRIYISHSPVGHAAARKAHAIARKIASEVILSPGGRIETSKTRENIECARESDVLVIIVKRDLSSQQRKELETFIGSKPSRATQVIGVITSRTRVPQDLENMQCIPFDDWELFAKVLKARLENVRPDHADSPDIPPHTYPDDRSQDIDVWIDPGTAPPELIRDIFEAISDVHEAETGVALRVKRDESESFKIDGATS